MKELVSLAYLKTLWDKEKRDILDLYIPFLVEIFIRKSLTNFAENEIENIRNYLKEEFGLNIPIFALTSLLNRAKKRGILEKKEHRYYVIESKLENYRGNFSEAEDIIKRLVLAIREYINKKSPELSLTSEEIQDTLLNFLAQFDYQIIIDLDSLNSAKPLRKNEKLFILGKFVKHIYQEDPESWKLFQSVVIGNILSKLILYDPNFLKTKYKNLNAYLDTKIIFRLLGIEGEELKNAYTDFINELKEQGIKLFIFRHTYDEILGILETCYKFIDSTHYDPSKASLALKYFKGKGYHQSDVQLIINKIPKELKRMNIEIVDTPPYNHNPEYQIDEQELKKTILDVYSSNPRFEPSEKEYTIERDVKSISAIYRLRKGHKPVNLKEAKYIFITSNTGLSYAVLKFHKNNISNERFFIPPCVTDTFIGTLIWLNNPEKLNKITPLSILSTSIAVTQHSREFIEKWFSEIKKLKESGGISEEDYILLRDSLVSRELLDEKTLGDPELITPKTAVEILEEIRREGIKKYEEERKRREEAEKELEKLKREKEEHQQRLEIRSQKYANYFVIIISLLLALMVVFVATIISLKLISIIVSGILTFCGFLGITLWKLKPCIAKCIKNFLEGRQS